MEQYTDQRNNKASQLEVLLKPKSTPQTNASNKSFIFPTSFKTSTSPNLCFHDPSPSSTITWPSLNDPKIKRAEPFVISKSVTTLQEKQYTTKKSKSSTSVEKTIHPTSSPKNKVTNTISSNCATSLCLFLNQPLIGKTPYLRR